MDKFLSTMLIIAASSTLVACDNPPQAEMEKWVPGEYQVRCRLDGNDVVINKVATVGTYNDGSFYYRFRDGTEKKISPGTQCMGELILPGRYVMVPNPKYVKPANLTPSADVPTKQLDQ